MNRIKAFKIRLEDRLRYSPRVRQLLARWYEFKASRQPSAKPQQIARTIDTLCKAARLSDSKNDLLRVEERIREKIRQLDRRKIDWTEFEKFAKAKRIFKAAVLKPRVSDRERGVVYISFEYQLLPLLQIPNLSEFARDYSLVVIPVWSPPHCLVNYLLPEIYPDPVIWTINMQRDLDDLARIAPKNTIVPLLCSNWVNPALLKPRPFHEKDIDILIVANWGKYKRHHVFFDALRELPASTRVLLVGHSDGQRTDEVLRAEAATFGVAGRFELRQRVKHREVATSSPAQKSASFYPAGKVPAWL